MGSARTYEWPGLLCLQGTVVDSRDSRKWTTVRRRERLERERETRTYGPELVS